MPALTFREYVGVDYSGAGDPGAGCSGLRVYRATASRGPAEVRPGGARRWSRRALAAWLLARLAAPGPVIVGLDHGFSFPEPWLLRRAVRSWDALLADFCARWPTDVRSVASCRPPDVYAAEVARLRLCERWTSSAKSVFQFGMNGQVATSTHAGLPWLRWLRARAGPRVHFWPFDGWRPPRRAHVVAEVYPSLFRNRYARDGRNPDQQDAFAVAAWLRERDALRALPAYFAPRLTARERRTAALEGWILGLL